MESLLELKGKELKKELKKFVKDNPINPGETKDWYLLIQKFLDEYQLDSSLYDDDNLSVMSIKLAPGERTLLEKMLYYVENIDMSLFYVFEGHVS